MSESDHLETMEPNPVWVQDAYADTVDVLERHGRTLEFHIWGGDWCTDCRAQLPDFGAALEAAEIPASRIHHYPTEKVEDGSKTGPGVAEYGIEYIPTVVVEHDGEEIARFVEEEPVPIAVYLADRIDDAL